MADEALVTAETVTAAAEAITARGEKPTVLRIRAELGGGSPNAVLTHLRTWKEERQAAAAPEASPAPENPAGGGSALATLDALPEVGPAVDNLIAAFLASASRIQAAERRTAEEQIAGLTAAHAQELAAHDQRRTEDLALIEERLADANAELEEALPSVSAAEELRGRVAALEAEGTALREQVASVTAELSVAQAALAEAIEGRTAAVAASERADGEARAWRDQLTRSQTEAAEIRREAAGAAAEAQAATDAVRAQLAEATATVRGQAERIESLVRDVERERGEAERLRAARDAADTRITGLLERATTAEAVLAAMPQDDRQSPAKG